MLPKRILVVDDEVEICELLCLQLSRKGFQCQSASGVNEALSLLAESTGQYSAVLCDYSMKDGTGLEVFEQVKKQVETLFVLISGFSQIEEEELQAKGIRYILNKPVKFQELLRLIQTAASA